MNYPQEMVDLYAAFYRPRIRRGVITSANAVKPIDIAGKILLHPDNFDKDLDELKDSIAAENYKLMRQVHAGTSAGCSVLRGEAEKQAIRDFAVFFVDRFFLEGCYGRRDLLSGNKFALVKHTCEFLINDPKYRLKQKS